jgi:hypothetical protein
MRSKLRSRLTYANVMATIAVFMALGGAATLAATSSCTGGVPCVNSDDIIDGQVKTPDLGTGAVTNAKLAANSVSTGKVIDNNLKGADLLNGTVATADLANGAVTPAKVGTIPAARVRKSASQSIPNNTLATLAFDIEDFDTAALHDTAVNNTRLTAPISGVYQVSAGVAWDANATGFRELSLGVNGGCPGTPGQVGCAASSVVNAVSTGGGATHQTVSTLQKLSAGDFVEAVVQQQSGGNLSANAQGQTFLAMTWVGPG